MLLITNEIGVLKGTVWRHLFNSLGYWSSRGESWLQLT